MLDVLKQWSQRLKTLNHRRLKNQIPPIPSLADIKVEDEEPQELSLTSEDKCFRACYTNIGCEDINSIDSKNYKSSKTCECSNCTALPNLTECEVCLEPLQGHNIESCPICSNFICGSCASRLASCAFCRTGLPMQRNRALERLLDRLVLPCRNSRYGCEVLLNLDHRFSHEAICSFSIVICPLASENCLWSGPTNQIESHMKNVHHLEPLQDCGISVEIYSFRKKAQAVDGRQYTICLSCFDQLFFVKIIVFKGRLKLSFSKLGYTKRVLMKPSLPKYGVSIKIHGSCKNMKGILPFENQLNDTREIDIKCQRLYSNRNVIDEKDLVKIDLVVKQLNNCN